MCSTVHGTLILTGQSQLSVSSVPYGLQLAPYCDGTRARRPRGSQLNYKLAGMVGFEPTMLARQINSLLP